MKKQRLRKILKYKIQNQAFLTNVFQTNDGIYFCPNADTKHLY